MKPTLVIAGLGNPGANYERTRHNLGFQAMDVLSQAFGEGEWKESAKFHAMVQEGRIVTVPVLLVKPLTFMNRSGEALKKIVEFYKIDAASQMLVLSDDVDLPLGEHRLRLKGGPGTHNGLKSVVEQFGENFARLRIGLGTPSHGEDLGTWVLSALSPEEQRTIRQVYDNLPDIVRSFVLDELEE